MTTEPREPRRNIGIIGGGTAGYLVALALLRHRPDCDVTLIESSRVPVIGVGEGTTPLMVAFLHRYLGLDVASFVSEVEPTTKLGVRLLWGRPDHGRFDFAFDTSHISEALAHDGRVDTGSLGAHLMQAEGSLHYLSPELRVRSLGARVPYAYHLDNKRFLRYLQREAARRSLRVIDGHIEHVATNEHGVASLHLGGDHEISFDLYIDCSGFRSLLLGDALDSEFISYASSLPTDRAIVAKVPQSTYGPYTTAETMTAGWCWGLPQSDSNHRGYVYSSAHLGADQAEAEMRATNPGMGDAREVRFRSGRRTEWWKDNVVGVGNAYGFVEPLEATALHMVLREASHIVSNLDAASSSDEVRRRLNASIGGAWDYLRDYLAVHYKFNRRVDSDFWRECRETIGLGSLEPAIERVTDSASSNHGHVGQGNPQLAGPPAIGAVAAATEVELVLLGQGACDGVSLPATVSADAWQRRQQRLSMIATRTLKTPESATLAATHPGLQDRDEAGWVDALAESLMHPA